MNENSNYRKNQHYWSFPEALVVIVAIICGKEIIMQGLKMAERNSNKKEDK